MTQNMPENMTERPIIAITMGDPAGVGPEITAKALARDEVWHCCRPIVIGDLDVLAQAITLVAVPLTPQPVADVARARFAPARMNILDPGGVDLTALRKGEVSATAGQAAVIQGDCAGALRGVD